MTLRIVASLLLLTGCAAPPEPPPRAIGPDGLLPGSIGLLAKHDAAGVIVADLKKDGAAAAAGVRAGDVVVRYNGAPVSSLREFNRLVLDSPPGSVIRLELLRNGDSQSVEVPVRELDTMPRV